MMPGDAFNFGAIDEDRPWSSNPSIMPFSAE